MRKQVIDKQATTTANADHVFALLIDGSTWPDWSGIGSFVLEQAGDDGGESLNAIRAFRTGRTTSRERIVELVPNRRFSYALLTGLPLKDYRADIDLTPRDGGTQIRWRSTFFPKWRGTGWIYRLALGKFIRDAVNGLADHAARVPAERTTPPR
ncbi:MAG: hypothetical protein QOI95_1095 [Acidimicrobiaceae bacterium]|jgi:hypothetical protein